MQGKRFVFFLNFVHNIKIYLLCPWDGWWRKYKVTVYSTKAMPIFMNTLTLHCQQSTKHTADFRMSTKGKILYRFLFGSVVHIITGLNKCESFRSDKQYKNSFLGPCVGLRIKMSNKFNFKYLTQLKLNKNFCRLHSNFDCWN